MVGAVSRAIMKNVIILVRNVGIDLESHVLIEKGFEIISRDFAFYPRSPRLFFVVF